ncbi:MAG: sulfide/dihydroorotate dehydrogenase-like FAD/NAD-binding protein [Planctomycetaceae bacterium]|nr:sulfide/dihydroorotate dehydrogenase-like FAD/NAD-binding protein [Planctomycetaceae bacterium]
MSTILKKTELASKIWQIEVEAPRIAEKALPGHFVVVMADAFGERVPLTIADFDRQAGTITLVMMVVGASSLKLSRLEEGDEFYALIGPLGHPSEIKPLDRVVMVAGGVGAAPIFPIARAYQQQGTEVVTVQGARSADLLFWTDRLASVSVEHVITTDDGSAGRRGLVTEPLAEQLAADSEKRIGGVYAIGPTPMMKFCAKTTEPFCVPTVVSLNSIMIDGTGMCGGCRVTVAKKTLFTCVDGPEFDGHQVDWDSLMSRQRTYHTQEGFAFGRMLAEPAPLNENILLRQNEEV